MFQSLFKLGLGLAAATALTATSQAQESYRLPPQDLVDIVDAAPSPWTSLSPSDDTLLLMHREALPPVAELARPMERLAGLRLDATLNGRHGPRSIVGLSFIDLDTGEERNVDLPEDAGISFTTWSPDGSQLAFVMTRNDTLSLWVVDVATARARQLVRSGINAVFSPIDWMPSGDQILVSLVDPDRGPMPVEPRVPAGPVIQEASGYEAPVRTYQDLLEDEHDAALFAWLSASQLALVNTTGRPRLREIGEQGLYYSTDPAPGGDYILVGEMNSPSPTRCPGIPSRTGPS